MIYEIVLGLILGTSIGINIVNFREIKKIIAQKKSYEEAIRSTMTSFSDCAVSGEPLEFFCNGVLYDVKMIEKEQANETETGN